MDLSGSAYGVALPYSASANFGDDAGSGDVDMIGPAVISALQHHMNRAVAIAPDARDMTRSFSHHLRNTLNHAGEELTAFLRAPTPEDLPCVTRHRAFLSGLNTAGFVSSPSWMARNVRELVDTQGVLDDISGALGVSLTTLRSTLTTAMNMYLPIVEALDESHRRIEKKLQEIDGVTRQLLALPPVASADLEAAILRYASAQYESCGLQLDYESFCTNYAKFQAYRSVLGLVGSTPGPPTCSICMTDPVSCAIVPCGHTFCNRCGQTQRSQCYLCRTPVRERQRLYFT